MDFASIIKFIFECDDEIKLDQIFDITKQKKKLLGDKKILETSVSTLIDNEEENKKQIPNIIDFINEKIEIKETKNELRLDEIHYELQQWCKYNFIKKYPSRKNLKIELMKIHADKHSKTDKNAWHNLIIINSTS